MNVEVRKGKGIDGLVSGYSPGKVEEEKIATTHGDSPLHKLMDRFEYFMEHIIYPESRPLYDVNHSFPPEQVSSILQIMTKYEKHRYYRRAAGLFINRLVQNSYNNGHNDFHLQIYSPIHDFCHKLLGGIKKQPLRLAVEGDLGRHFASSCKDVSVTVDGNLDMYCCKNAERSQFIIQGRAGECCALNAKHCTFTLEGDVGYSCGKHAMASAFRTSNKRTLDLLIANVGKRNQLNLTTGNKIIFVHLNGEEEVVRDYSGSSY